MDFIFLAGNAALDFLNTVPVLRGEPVDLLDSPSAVFRWLTAAGMVDAVDAKAADRRWRGDAEVLERARVLREGLREVVEAMLHGRRPPDRALAAVNGLLVVSASVERLRWDERGPRLERRYRPASAAAATAPVAELAARFLCEADPALLRRCENPDCVLYFYDTSKNHGRRWCSMAVCGNRMKVAEYRRRQN